MYDPENPITTIPVQLLAKQLPLRKDAIYFYYKVNLDGSFTVSHDSGIGMVSLNSI